MKVAEIEKTQELDATAPHTGVRLRCAQEKLLPSLLRSVTTFLRLRISRESTGILSTSCDSAISVAELYTNIAREIGTPNRNSSEDVWLS